MNKAIVFSIAAAAITLCGLMYLSKQSNNKISDHVTESGPFTSYVTDLKCKRAVDRDCGRQCFSRGEQPALLLDGSNEVVRLKNAEEVKKYPAAHVETKGSRSDDVIVVSAVKAL